MSASPAATAHAAEERSQLALRLAELGIKLPKQVAAPAGIYAPAAVSGNLVFTAGQLPVVDGQLLAVGKVGNSVTVETAAACARTCALNALAATEDAIGSLDRVVRIVKVTGFVASDPGFAEQARVLNGASQLLADLFDGRGVHARSAVGVAALPLDAPTEVELTVEFR